MWQIKEMKGDRYAKSDSRALNRGCSNRLFYSCIRNNSRL